MIVPRPALPVVALVLGFALLHGPPWRRPRPQRRLRGRPDRERRRCRACRPCSRPSGASCAAPSRSRWRRSRPSASTCTDIGGAGGPEITILRRWVGLVADGTCAPDGGGDATGGELWTANCASCHGADARGVNGTPNVRCNRAIHDVARDGRVGTIGEMPAFPNLDDDAIARIQDYLSGLCGEDATGDDLVASNCATCHGADGGGTAIAPDVRCTVPSRLVDAIRTGRGTDAMPAFPPATLTDADVTLIVAALAARCDGTPAGLYASNCLTCHGDTAGGGVGADGVRGPNIRCQETPDFLEKVQGGGDGMPGFPELDATSEQALCARRPLDGAGGWSNTR